MPKALKLLLIFFASSSVCPLTPIENHLRQRGGQAGYPGGFLAHYLHGVLYPEGLVPRSQWGLALLLVLINALAYGGWWYRLRVSREQVP